MNQKDFLSKILSTISLLLALLTSLSACGNSDISWKEEVLLHDGSKLIVERMQSYGGRHEIGQSSPIKEHEIKFSVNAK